MNTLVSIVVPGSLLLNHCHVNCSYKTHAIVESWEVSFILKTDLMMQHSKDLMKCLYFSNVTYQIYLKSVSTFNSRPCFKWGWSGSVAQKEKWSGSWGN